MTLSVGPATDYLVTKAQEAVAAITVNGQDVQVVDGWPHAMSDGMFVVGIDQPAPEPGGDATGTQAFVGLGAQRIEEDYVVPCYIDVRLPDTTAQKSARDLAAAIFDAFWPLIRADLTLGGTLHGGRYAELTPITHTPSNTGTVAAPGRRHVVTFGVHCRNLTS